RLLFPHLAKVKDEELLKAVSVARHLGLDPVKKEVHFVPYSGSVQMIVSYTEYIKRAERSGKLNGWQVDFGKDDFGEFAEITIYRKDWDTPFKWKVYMQEARQKSPTWDKMPAFMLRKVAIAQGFRLAFPEETAELPYEEAEVPANGFYQQQTPQSEEVVEPEIPDEPKVEFITDRQLKALHAIAKKKNVDIKQVIADKYGLTSTKDLTKEQASELIDELQKQEEPDTAGVPF
ncbi:RecT family recombinase, partial [Persephonella sp.]